MEKRDFHEEGFIFARWEDGYLIFCFFEIKKNSEHQNRRFTKFRLRNFLVFQEAERAKITVNAFFGSKNVNIFLIFKIFKISKRCLLMGEKNVYSGGNKQQNGEP